MERVVSAPNAIAWLFSENLLAFHWSVNEPMVILIKKCISQMHCKSLWIKVSAKCTNVHVNIHTKCYGWTFINPGDWFTQITTSDWSRQPSFFQFTQSCWPLTIQSSASRRGNSKDPTLFQGARVHPTHTHAHTCTHTHTHVGLSASHTWLCFTFYPPLTSANKSLFQSWRTWASGARGERKDNHKKTSMSPSTVSPWGSR